MPVRPPHVMVALAIVALAGCVTGPRPTLGDPLGPGGATGVPTGVAAVDRVLAPLEGDVPGPFTATYEVTRKLGSVSTTATVVRDADHTSVTVGDVRFLSGTGDETCDLATGGCDAGIHDERISDYGIPSSFWLGSPARLLRVAAARTSGTPTPFDATIAGLPVACVEVPVGPGAEKYCVTPGGPIASVDTNATYVHLTQWAGSADPAALAPPS